MKVPLPHRRRSDWLWTAAAALVGLALGALYAGWNGAMTGAILGAVAASAVVQAAQRRLARRQHLMAQPFPDVWREILTTRCDHYDRLSAPLRRRFERGVRVFVAEKRVTGIGLEVTDELRLLVAASAGILALGWPDYEWEQLAEVLLYPDDFDRDYEIGRDELAGQAHGWGTVILSVPALIESFADPDDGFHVGLHELAHLLDVEGTQFDGLPTGLDDRRVREFIALREKEMERLRRGKSVLDEYGASDPVEFFPVAVEAFFEPALALRRRHRELYDFLAEYFGQDPARWDDERGLTI
jgi:Mlc titration factor MtfA (ptsG expression regulator)